MKSKFTKLIAALALLLFVAPPIVGWGQTTVTWPGTSALPGTATAVANDQNVTIKTSSTNTYTNPIRIYANTTVTINVLNGAKILSVAYEASSTGNYVTYAQNATVTPDVTPTVSGKFVTWTYAESANVTNFTFTPSSQTRSNGISITYVTGDTPTPTDPTISVNPSNIAFGEQEINDSYEETFTVSYANLTQDLTVTGFEGITVSPANINVGEGTGEAIVTVTYAPTAVGNISGDITVSNTDDEVSETVAVTGSAYDPSSIVYYNLVEGEQTDWSGVYIITYAGSTYYEALSGVSNNLGSHTTVTVDEDRIISNATTNAYAVTITKTAGNNYSMQIGGQYLYAQSSNNLYADDNYTAQTCEWTIAWDEDNSIVKITNVSQSTRRLQYNSSSPRFACYTGSQKDLTLFKLANENQVATPTFNPTAGTYYAAQDVSIACATEGAAIQYKTTENGEWQSYTAAISVNETTTIWAKASKEGMDDSQVASATYTITLPTVETPTFSPEAGTYTSAQNVSITCETSGATIYYTTDGTTPTAESTQYTDAIAVAANTTIKAIAVKEGMIDSEVATAEYTILNIVHAGTEADPYTVADARTAIDANIGVDNVYATGIVSEIVTEYSGQYQNITFDIVDEAGNTNFLRAYRCGGTQAADVQVGDIVVVSGNLILHNSIIYEFAQGCQLVSLTHPQSTEPAVTLQDYSIDVPAAGGEGNLTVTYENITEVVAQVYFYDANGNAETYSWIEAGIDANNNVYYIVDANNGEARTAYLKVYALDDNGEDVYSNLITITQEKFVVDYATLPFAYDGNGTGTLPAGFTVDGLGTYSSSPKMQFNSTGDWAILKINERPGELGFDIKGNSFSGGTFKVQTSTDGVNYSDLATYTALDNTQHKTFNNLGNDVRYIKWIYTTKSSGNVGLGNITLAKYTAPQSYNLTIATSNDVTIIATNENITGSITNGGTAPVYSGSLVTLDVRPAADYVLDEILVTDADNGTHSVVPLENGLWGFYMPSNNVTVSAVMVASHSPVTYTLATTVEPGRHYIIVGENSGVYYAMGAQKPNNRAAKQISIDGTTATVTRSDVYEFTIDEVDEGVYSIQDDSNEGYLAAGSSSSNNLVTIEELTTNNGQWTIEIGVTTGEATVVAQGGSNNYMQFNHTSTLFSCYGASNNQHPVYLYVKNDRFQLDINGYTGTNDNYYLIASPVTVDPSTIDMTTGDFDLYAFNQAEDKEWRNWKGDENLNYTGHFNLVPGQGYLYAKKATEETSTYSFTLTGDLYTGNGKFQLVDGWNLLGNPYAYATQLDVTDYAVMNDAHDAIIPADDEELENPYPAIQRLQGVFVWGEAGSSVTFSPVETNTGAKHAGIVLNLTKNRGSVADRAIVRFGEGQQMPKFQLNENTPKLYIPQGGNAFSVVRSGNESEMPVNFEAEANGTYTLNVEVNALEVNYLHLIDNMTGADIDLLATPSYTFSAKTTDYASRFRLVFNASGINEDGASTSSAAFAFYNGSSWTVSNLGEATLQVVDVMGRVLSSETISGNTEVSLNQPAGIYMLRLINGNDVKVQKIVVR